MLLHIEVQKKSEKRKDMTHKEIQERILMLLEDNNGVSLSDEDERDEIAGELADLFEELRDDL